MRKRLANIPFPLYFVVPAPFVLLAPILVPGKAMFWGLPMLQFVPWWTQAWHTILLGQIPLWNPLVGLGAPLLANYQTALLYPPTWLLIPFATIGDAAGIAYGLGWLTTGHLLWAGIGMLELTRELGWRDLPRTISALAFMLSGYLAARTHFPSILFSAIWLPWLMWAGTRYARKFQRRDLLLLTLITAFQFLAGHAQTTWYSIQLVAAWIAVWAWATHGVSGILRGWRGYLLAGIGALIMSAAQLLPTAEYLRLSQRAVEVDPQMALINSFWPWRLLGYFMPGLWGNPTIGDFWGYATFWEDAVYLGIPAIFLALIAVFRREKNRMERVLVRFSMVVGLIAFILAWGKDSPVFMFLYEHVPTFSMFKSPARYMLWAEILLALLAGLGAQYWRKPIGRGLYWSNLSAAGAFAITVTVIALLTWQKLGGVAGQEIHTSLFRAPILFGVVLTLFLMLHLRAPDTPGLGSNRWRIAVAGLAMIDLLIAGWGLNPPISASFYSGLSAPYLEVGERFYMPVVDEQALTYERFHTFSSFEITEDWDNARVSLLPNLFMLDGLSSINNFDPLVPNSYDLMMTEIEPEDIALLSGLNIGVIVTRNPTSLFMPIVISPTEGVPRRIYPLQENSGAVVELVEDTPNRLVIEIRADEAFTLVVADQYYPGWVARLDGENVQIESDEDRLLRWVNVPSGEHRLEMVYRPLSFYGGGALSILGWSTWLYFWRRTWEN